MVAFRIPCRSSPPVGCSGRGELGHTRACQRPWRRGPPRLQLCRVTNTQREMRDPRVVHPEDDEYMDLGPQHQQFRPEEGPMEQRVATTFVEGLFSDKVDLEESEYWLTEPLGGWNSDPKLVKKAKQAPNTMNSPNHFGEGRAELQDLDEGAVLTGTVECLMYHHGVQVDIGAQYDGLIPVFGDEWAGVGHDFYIDQQLEVRVHKVIDNPRCRWPIQLSVVSPDLQAKLADPDEFQPGYDLRGLATVEQVMAATGLSYDEITGGKAYEVAEIPEEEMEDYTQWVQDAADVEEFTWGGNSIDVADLHALDTQFISASQ